MAEFVFKDVVKKKGLEDKLYIASAATSFVALIEVVIVMVIAAMI